jgi:1-acyl-sn-glycerol-3-phosphate acyltransferase
MVLIVLSPDPANRSPRDWRWILRWMVTVRGYLGLKVTISGQPAPAPTLYVANHISWHDIVVIQSLVPTGFIAKHEIRGWPLFGWLAHHGNTLFIRRGKRESAQQIADALSARLQGQQSILIFPEGTTTPGDTVKPFRTRLFEPAIELGLPIQPVAIHYSSDDKHVTELSFINDETFITHGWRLLGEKTISAVIHFCEPIQTRGLDRRTVGLLAHAEVKKALTPYLRYFPENSEQALTTEDTENTEEIN